MSEGPHLDTVRSLCLALPEAAESGEQHRRFEVRNKTFAYYLRDHHGDGRIALCCKAAPGARDVLLEGAPERFFVPPYIGVHGWVGLYLDRPFEPEEPRMLIEESYRLVAPKRLATLVSAAAGARR